MNKRNKIIVSIVGIIIVLLALLGITYAYYLTRIEGNTNTNSISVTTANLKLSYGDGNGDITTTNIMPGTTIGEKTFTVKNEGNATVRGYAVSLDYAYLEGIVPSVFVRPQDFEITLTCETSKTGETCNGYDGNFNNESIMLTSNDIDQDEVHTYSLSIYYNDPSVDQSDDMGKNLNLKVQIYNLSETTDIEGTITGVDASHSVRIESEPKMSTIVNGKYNFKGIEVGTHTLTVLDESGNEVDKEYIVVKSGTTPGIIETKTTIDDEEVDATQITITKDERIVRLNTKVESNVLSFETSTSSTSIFNPYSSNKNSLAYNLINNAIIAKENNSTTEAIYSPTPITTPGKTTSGITFTEGDWSTTPKTLNTSSWKNSWGSDDDMCIFYSDDYKYDEDSGKYYFEEQKYCNYLDCYEDLVGKYTYDSWNGIPCEYIKSEINGRQTSIFNYKYESNIYELHKIESVSETGYTYKTRKSTANAAIHESVLSKVEDEYGDSYYYRGNVQNNYVTFSGMCWRIVRIQGDGTIKLILADESSPCSGGTYSPTNNNTGYGSNVYNLKPHAIESWATGGTYTILGVYNEETREYEDITGTHEIKIAEAELNKYLADTNWCYDESRISYAENMRLYNVYFRLSLLPKALPTLKCNMTGIEGSKAKKHISKFGIISADEAAFAGLSKNSYAKNIIGNYLYTNASSNNFYTSTRMEDEEYSTGEWDYFYGIVHKNGSLGSDYYFEDESAWNALYRPMIALKSNIVATTDSSSSYVAGTYQNPYIIN